MKETALCEPPSYSEAPHYLDLLVQYRIPFDERRIGEILEQMGLQSVLPAYLGSCPFDQLTIAGLIQFISDESDKEHFLKVLIERTEAPLIRNPLS